VDVKSGWAELVDPVDLEAMARGCVFIEDPPLPCPLDGHWRGEMRFVRGAERLRDRGDIWLLWFEGGTQHRWVQLTALEPMWTHVGERIVARLISCDDRYPAEVIELGGDA
jgi:hypothetical protein